MRRIVLTGASGFIGRRLRRHLKEAGFDVIAVTRSLPIGEEETFLEVSRLDAPHLRPALEGVPVDAFIHLAAAGVNPADRDITRLLETNGFLPAELVRLAHGLGARAFVMAGSNSEYAPTSAPITESAALETVKAYGTTKAAGGMLAVAAGTSLGLPTVNLRLFNVFGPGEAPHRLLPSLLAHLQDRRSVPLSEGLQQRDFIHVDEACAALLAALSGMLEGGLPSGHYNVCSGVGVSVKEFALAAADALGADRALLDFGAIPMRPDDLPRVIGDGSVFERYTGWRPAKPFELALQSAVHEMLPSTSRG